MDRLDSAFAFWDLGGEDGCPEVVLACGDARGKDGRPEVAVTFCEAGASCDDRRKWLELNEDLLVA